MAKGGGNKPNLKGKIDDFMAQALQMMGEGGTSNTTVQEFKVTMDNSEFEKVKAKTEKGIKELQKLADKGIEFGVSDKEIFDSKKVQDKVKDLESVLSSVYSKVYEKNETLGKRDVQNFVTGYLELDQYLEKVGGQMESRYTDLINSMRKSFAIGKTGGFLPYGMSKEEIAEIYGNISGKYQTAANNRFNTTWNPAQTQMIDAAKQQAEARETEAAWRKTEKRLGEIEARANQLKQEMSDITSQGFDADSKSDSYFEDKLSEVQKIRKEANELRDDLRSLSSEIPPGSDDVKKSALAQSSNLNDIYNAAQEQEKAITTAMQRLADASQEAERIAREQKEARVKQIEQMMSEDEDFQKYGNADWLEKYKERAKESTEEIIDIFRDFKKEVDDVKAESLRGDEVRGKMRESDNFLKELAGGDPEKLREYRSRFRNELNRFWHESELSVSEMKERIANELGVPYTGGGNGSGIGEGMQADSASIEAGIDRLNSAAKEAEEAYETVAEIRDRVRSAYQERNYRGIDSDDDYHMKLPADGYELYIDEEENRIKELTRISKELHTAKERIQTELSWDEERYQDYVQSGDIQSANYYKESIEDNYKRLLKYRDLSEYISKELNTAIVDFKPGDSWGTNEITMLISALQALVHEVQEISKAFGQIDDEANIPPLLSQFQSLGDVIHEAFDPQNLEKFSSQINVIADKLTKMYSSIGSDLKGNMMELPVLGGSDGGNVIQPENIKNAWTARKSAYSKAYDKVIELFKNYDSRYDLYSILSLYSNVENNADIDELYKQFSSGSLTKIEDAEQYIQRVISFFNHIQKLLPTIIPEGGVDRSADIEALKKRMAEEEKAGELTEERRRQIEQTIKAYKEEEKASKALDKYVFNRGASTRPTLDIKEARKAVDIEAGIRKKPKRKKKGEAEDDVISEQTGVEVKNLQQLYDELAKSFESLQSVMSKGLGVRELENGTTTSFLNELVEAMMEVTISAENMTNSLKQIADIDIAGSVRKAADAITEEGESASVAAKLKDGFAKANEKVADSANGTAPAIKKATDAIEEEGDAAKEEIDSQERRAKIIEEFNRLYDTEENTKIRHDLGQEQQKLSNVDDEIARYQRLINNAEAEAKNVYARMFSGGEFENEVPDDTTIQREAERIRQNAVGSIEELKEERAQIESNINALQEKFDLQQKIASEAWDKATQKIDEKYKVKEDTDTSLPAETQKRLEAGNPYEVQVKPNHSLVAAIQAMLDGTDFNINIGVKGKSGGESPSELISQMVGADSIMMGVSGKDALRERGMAFNSKTGYHTNPFVFGNHGSISSDLTNAVLNTVTEEVDTWMHTHPELFPAFSLSNKKGNNYNGDLRASYTAYKNKGINTEINAAQNQVAIFDAKSFYDIYGDLFEDANIDSTMQKIYEARVEAEERFRKSFKSLSKVFNIEEFSVPFEELLNKNFDLPDMAPKFQEMLASVWKDSFEEFSAENFTSDFMKYVDSLPDDYGKSIKEVFIEFISKSFSDANINPDEIQKYLGDGADFSKAIGATFESWFSKLTSSDNYLPRIQQMITPEILKNAIGVQDFGKFVKYLSIPEFKQQYTQTGGETNAYNNLSQSADKAAKSKTKLAESEREVAATTDTATGKLKEENLEFNSIQDSSENANPDESIINTKALQEAEAIAKRMQEQFTLTDETTQKLTESIAEMIQTMAKGKDVGISGLKKILSEDEITKQSAVVKGDEDAKEIRSFLRANKFLSTDELRENLRGKFKKMADSAGLVGTYTKDPTKGLALDVLLPILKAQVPGFDSNSLTQSDIFEDLVQNLTGKGGSKLTQMVDDMMNIIMEQYADQLMNGAFGVNPNIGISDVGKLSRSPVLANEIVDEDGFVDTLENIKGKYEELQTLIKTGDKYSISQMLNIDESDLDDIEKVKNNFKEVLDVLEAGGIDTTKVSGNWWNGWLSGGRDLLDSDSLLGAYRTLGISDETITKVRLGNIDSADGLSEYISKLNIASSSAEELKVILEKINEVGGLDKLTLPTDKLDQFTAKLEEVGLAEKKVEEELVEKENVKPEEKQEGVDDSVLSTLEREVELFERIAKAAQEASQAKSKFSDANREAAKTASDTSEKAEKEAEAMHDAGEEAKKASKKKPNMPDDAEEDNSDKWAKRTYRMSPDDEIMGKTETSKEKQEKKHVTTTYKYGQKLDDEGKPTGELELKGYDITNDYEAAEKARAKAEADAKKAKDRANAYVIKQGSEIERLVDEFTNEKYAKVKMDEEDAAELQTLYEDINKLLSDYKGDADKQTDTNRAKIEQSIKDYKKKASLAIARQQVATELQASSPEAAKEKQKKQLVSLQGEMHKLNEKGADTSGMESELLGIIQELDSADDLSKEFLANIRSQFNILNSQFQAKKITFNEDKGEADKYAKLSMKQQLGEELPSKDKSDLDWLTAKYEALNQMREMGLELSEREIYLLQQKENADKAISDAVAKQAQQQQTKEDLQLLEEYIQKRKEYETLRSDAVKKGLTDEQSTRLSQLSQEIDKTEEITKAVERLNKAREEGTVKTDSQANKIDSLVKQFNGRTLTSDAKYKDDLDSIFGNIENRLAKTRLADESLGLGGWRPKGWAEEVDKLIDKIDTLKEKASKIDFSDPKGVQDYKEIRQEIQETTVQLTNLNKQEEWKPVNTTWADSFTSKVSKWMDTNKMAAKAFKDDLDKVKEAIKDVDNQAQAAEVENMFSKIETNAANEGLLGKSLGDRFKDQFKNTMTSLATYYLSFQDFIRYGREAIQIVRELDTAMTELKKVSDESAQTYSNFLKGSFDMADQVGSTAQQIIDSTADWKRLGKSFEESQKLAQETTILKNVSEFENISDATQAMVSATQAYQEVDSMDIIDKLNYIGNNYAVSTSDLATGLQNAAAVLKTQGNNIDESLALLTSGNLINQDISKASMGVRTISLRISGTEEAKNEIRDMGEDVDDFVVRTKSKTDQIIRDYTAVASNAYQGVSVLDENGNLRNTYDILLDISKIYKEIQEEDKQRGTNRAQALIETLAGKTRSNIAASILLNGDVLESVKKSSENESAGSAQKELNTYLDSVEGKIAKLQNRLQELASAAVGSDLIKTVIDGLTTILELANSIVDTFGTLPTIIGAVAGVLAQKNGMGLLGFDKNAKGLDKLVTLPWFKDKEKDVALGKKKSDTVAVEQESKKEQDVTINTAAQTGKAKAEAEAKAEQKEKQKQQAKMDDDALDGTIALAEEQAEAEAKVQQEAQQKANEETAKQAAKQAEILKDQTNVVAFPSERDGKKQADDTIESIKKVEKEVEKANDKEKYTPVADADEVAEDVIDVAQTIAGAEEAAEIEPKVNAEQAKEALEGVKEQAEETGQALTESIGESLEGGGILDKIKGFGKNLMGGLANIGVNVLSGLATGLITTVVSSIVMNGLSALYDMWYKTTNEFKIKAGEEAQASITDTKSQYDQKATSINEIKDEFAKLSTGVSSSGKNLTLSEEEYSRFLELSSQIAEIAPELVTGYTSQGEAIVALGNNVDDVNGKFQEYLNLQRDIANADIGSNLDTVFTGIQSQASEYNDLLTQAQEDSENAKAILSDNTEKTPWETLGAFYVGDDDSPIKQDTVSNQTQFLNILADDYTKFWDVITSVKGAEIEPIPDDSIPGLQRFRVNLEKVSRTDLQRLEGFVNSNESSSQRESKIADATAKKYELLMENEYKKAIPAIQDYINTSPFFDDLGSEELQNKFKNGFINVFSNLDYQEIADDVNAKGGLEAFVDDFIFTMLSSDDTKEAFKDLTDLAEERGKMTADEYQAAKEKYYKVIQDRYRDSTTGETLYTNEYLDSYFGDDLQEREYNAVKKLGVHGKSWFGFMSALHDANIDNEDAALTAIENMSQDQAERLAGDYDAIIKYLTPYLNGEKIKDAAKSEGTLADLFNDEDYKSEVENYKSSIQTLVDARDTLLTEGQLSDDQKQTLRESFTGFGEEITSEDLASKAVDQLSGWMNKIREAMKGMSEEEKKQAQYYIRDVVGSYADLFSEADVREAFIDQNYNKMAEQAGYSRGYFGQQFDKKIEDLRAQLPEGEELDMQVVYELMMSNQFSGPADEIYNQYKDVKLYWDVILDNKELEKDITTRQARLGAEEAKRSAKEARGETITGDDYSLTLDLLRSNEQTRAKQVENAYKAWAKNPESKELQQAYYNALAELNNSQAETEKTVREQAEAGANKTLDELDRSNAALSSAQQKVQEAEKNGGKAAQSLYDAVASEQENQANINRDLGDYFQGLADKEEEGSKNQVYWQNKANDYYSASLTAEADAKENRLNPVTERYNKLQHESEQLQRQLTVAEQKHQKVSKKTYQDLIANGQKQINSLRQQQQEVDDYSEDWWNLQSSIESMQDSIYDWSTTLDNLVVDQATNLASAISTAMQESMSDTGLTDETISSLVSGFSDVLGKDFDQSDMFYNTADGIKMNVEAVRELTQAEFDLQATNLADEIQRTQDALNAHPGNSALEEQLKSLMQTQAQFFAQYEEMQKALSYNALMDLAESTTNQGANFDANVERQKKYKEAWDEGWTGTDDFKAWTSYLDAWGRDTAEAYEAVSEKAARYFTEDATEGLGNFLEDLRSQGYATQDEEGFWDINVDDYDKAAQSMRMGSDWFMDMMTKLEEQDFTHTYVDSLTEAQLKTQDLDQQIQNAVDTYDRMVASGGATDDELQNQIETINDLTSEYRDLQQVTDTWGKVQETKQKEEYLGMGDRLESLQTLYDSVDGEEAKEKVIEQARDLVESWGYTINEELAKQGTIQLSAESAEDYAARTYVGSTEKPLTAEEMGIEPEVAGEYVAMQKKITGEYENQKELFESISQYSTDQLRDIDHADGAWSAGEQELENICDALGVSYDNADMLVNALASMGLIKAPELVDEIPDKIKQGKEAVQEFLDVRGGLFKDMNLDADITEMGTEALDSRIDKLEALRRNFAEGSDEFEYLTGEIGKTEAQLSIQTKLEGGDTTLKQLKDIRDDKEAIAEAFNIDMNSEDAAAQIAAIQEQIDAMDLGYDMTVHIDEQQFADLMEGITGEPYEVEVGADTDPLTEGVETAKDKLSNETIELGVDTDSDGTDKIHGATTAIKEEGEAAEEAVPKKEEFAEANKQVAESAVNTEEATEGAGDGMLSEASASINSMNKPLISGDLINKVANAAGDFAEDFVDRYNTALENEQTKRTLQNMSGEVIDGANEVGTLLGDTLNGIINNGKQYIENEQMKQEATDAIASVASDAADTADTVGQFLGDALKTAWDNGKKYIEEDAAQREEQKRAEEDRKHNRDEIYSPESTSSYQSNQGKPHSAEDDHETHKIQTPTEEPVEITANEVNVGEGKESTGDYSKDAKDKAIEWLAGLTGDSVDEVSSKRGQSLLGGSNAEISRTGIYGGRSNGPIQNTGLEELNRAKTAQKELQEFFSSHEDTLQQVSTLYEKDAQKAQSYFDVLANTPMEELQQIELGDGAYNIENTAAEDALQGIADQAGLSKEQILDLIQAIQQLNQTDVETNTPTETPTEQPDTTKISGAATAISMPVSLDDSQVQSDTDKIKTEVESTDAEVKPKLDISSLLSMAQNAISGISSGIQGAFSGGGKQQTTETKVNMDTSGAEKGASQVDKSMKQLSKESATAKVNVDATQALSAINSIRANLMTINGTNIDISVNSNSLVTAASRAASLSAKLSEVIAKKAQAGALGTAHASGTAKTGIVGRISSTISRAFASGTQDWTVGQDEKALVNELGQESIVIFCDDIRRRMKENLFNCWETLRDLQLQHRDEICSSVNA